MRPIPARTVARADAAFFAGRLHEASKLLSQAVCDDPGSLRLTHSLGIVLANLSDWAGACRLLERMTRIDPVLSTGLLEYGKACLKRGDFFSALSSLCRSLILDPGQPMAHVYLSNVLRRLRRFDEALDVVGRASTIDHQNALVLCEIGYSLRDSRDYAGSVVAFSRALTLDPNQPESLQTLGTCELQLGKFERGWRFYEFRWRSPEFLCHHQDRPVPRWRGDASIEGRKLLVFSEQGFGDTIQFLRFVDELLHFGAEITLLVPPELERLCASFLPVARVTSQVPSDSFAACCSLMSLPAILGTTMDAIPHARTSYLKSPDGSSATWYRRLGPRHRPRIGVCWSGRDNPMYVNRSISLGLFSSLFSRHLQFISLHKEIRQDDLSELKRLADSLSHFDGANFDFADTAGVIDQVDLVVSIDTAVAHLAGSMGKEVWILLPYRADWRWLIDRNDSPWYPRARLFRQSTEGDWEGVLQDVARALSDRFEQMNVND